MTSAIESAHLNICYTFDDNTDTTTCPEHTHHMLYWIYGWLNPRILQSITYFGIYGLSACNSSNNSFKYRHIYTSLRLLMSAWNGLVHTNSRWVLNSAWTVLLQTVCWRISELCHLHIKSSLYIENTILYFGKTVSCFSQIC